MQVRLRPCVYVKVSKTSEFVPQVVVNNGLSETEKKEKKALEKKLSEMEEELKV